MCGLRLGCSAVQCRLTLTQISPRSSHSPVVFVHRGVAARACSRHGARRREQQGGNGGGGSRPAHAPAERHSRAALSFFTEVPAARAPLAGCSRGAPRASLCAGHTRAPQRAQREQLKVYTPWGGESRHQIHLGPEIPASRCAAGSAGYRWHARCRTHNLSLACTLVTGAHML